MITITDKITPALKRQIDQLEQYPVRAEAEFKKLTPIRTGNARRRTNLKNQTIQANYPYVQPLDQGASRQAPQGMTVPFEQWVRGETKRIFGK
jgi:hypothetical protein